MKKLASLSVVVFLGLLATVGLAPSAQAYPEVVIDLTVDRTVLYGGEEFTATATANVVCDWTLEWNGDSRDKNQASSFVTTYTAPQVTKVTTIPLHGTCQYLLPDGATPVTGRAAAGPLTTWNRTIDIKVLPRGSAVNPPTDEELPNTGGPNVWLIVAGLGLVAGGSAVVIRSKRSSQAL